MRPLWLFINLEQSLGLVENDEMVLPWIADDSAETDPDVERFGYH